MAIVEPIYKIKCEKCTKQMQEENFYSCRNGERMTMCKKCLTLHVDNFNEDTYLWILEKMDFPYIRAEWTKILNQEYAKKPNGLTGTSVLGKYTAKMRLNHYSKYSWADSDMLNEQAKPEITEEQENMFKEIQRQYEAGEISEAQYRTIMPAEDLYVQDAGRVPTEIAAAAKNAFYDENQYLSEEDLGDPEKELTREDKLYLAMKWGRLYKPAEWIELEKKYVEMTHSFDIQDSDTEGTLILICKTYLKMNQAIDCGDMDGYQKLSRVYDTMRKSSNFTAYQNKDTDGSLVDSIGEFVYLCEKEGGFIPRFATDIPQDKVDLTLRDMNNFTYKLVTQDLGFGQQIEDALRKIQMQKETETEDEPSESLIEEQEDELEEIFRRIEEETEAINAKF